jgi:hypothetical protein
MGLRLQGSSAVTVGTPSQLNVSVLYNDEIHVTDEARAKDAASLTWVVIPRDGAAISSSGVFTATKSGEYMVTVTLDNGNNNPVFAETRVTVSDPDLTTTTEGSEEESTTTEVTESTSESTTTTTPTSGHAGTYKGTYLWNKGQTPLEFTVDVEGKVQGGSYFEDADMDATLTFSGQVSADGRLVASGTLTGHIKLKGQLFDSGVNVISLTGAISGEEFAGTMVDDNGGSIPITATRE